MIDRKSLFQTHMPLETRPSLQTHMPLGEAVPRSSLSMHREPGSIAVASTLQQLLDRLDRLTNWEQVDRAGMTPDLRPCTDLLERLGQPQNDFRSVHVTGTKGKGSVCTLVEAALTNAGWRAGRYASPHLQSIHERISIDGRPVRDDELAAALASALKAREAATIDCSAGARSTWFDVFTAAAFLAFARAGIEWVVVEVGLGGRLDSTNVITPDASVITNVELEHTDVLGDTIEQIAAEKAGIIKHGVPVVSPIAPGGAAGRVIAAAARGRSAPQRFVTVAHGATISEQNLAVAKTVLEVLGQRGVLSQTRSDRLGASDLPDAVAARAQLPGRMERFDFQVDSGAWIPVVLDGAHVAFAVSAAFRELHMQVGLQQRAVVLLAAGADKDARAIVSALVGHTAHVVCTHVGSPRPSQDPRNLAALATAAGLSAEVVPDPLRAFSRCCSLASRCWILVTGSLFLAGVLRAALPLRDYRS